jgi:hypothetical protein
MHVLIPALRLSASRLQHGKLNWMVLNYVKTINEWQPHKLALSTIGIYFSERSQTPPYFPTCNSVSTCIWTSRLRRPWAPPQPVLTSSITCAVPRHLTTTSSASPPRNAGARSLLEKVALLLVENPLYSRLSNRDHDYLTAIRNPKL